jgi:hypothetical protein
MTAKAGMSRFEWCESSGARRISTTDRLENFWLEMNRVFSLTPASEACANARDENEIDTERGAIEGAVDGGLNDWLC